MTSIRREIEARKRESVAQLLFKCARLVNDRALASMRRESGVPLRPAHTALFPHIDLEHGTRLTDLAEALGISKQAVGQLASEMVAMGVLERRPDPDDGRAKRICFPAGGRHAVLDGLDLLAAEEQRIREEIGDRHFRQLRRALLALEAVLDAQCSER